MIEMDVVLKIESVGCGENFQPEVNVSLVMP